MTFSHHPRQPVLVGVLLSVALNAVGQLLFKAARMAQPDTSVVKLFLHPETWAGLCIYGFSAVSWLWVLARAPLSLAYPILSLTFPIVLGLSALCFAEAITPLRWAGVGVIVIGVSLLART
jgi:drug/metabolite transporter (DMT)-like permease